MKFSYFDIFSIIIMFQLIVFVVFLIQKGKRKPSNISLAVFFLAQALGFFNSILTNSQYDYTLNNYPRLFNIAGSAAMLWGPSYFFYIKFLLRENSKLNIKSSIHLLPFAIVLVFNLIHFQFSNKLKIEEFLHSNSAYFSILSISLTALLILYNLLCLKILYAYKSNELTSTPKRTIFFWAKFFVYGYLFGCLINILGTYMARWFNSEVLNNVTFWIGHFYFFIFFNVIMYKALLKPEIFHSDITEPTKYSNSNLTKKQTEEIYTKLLLLLAKEKPYLSPCIKLNELALKMEISARHLSQVINVYENSNFSDYMNKCRIEFAKRVLLDENRIEKTILEIMFAAGFNSKSSFNAAFKKHTGITPLAFKKQNNAT